MPTLIKSACLEGFASMVTVWFFGVLLTSLSTVSSNTESSFYGSIYLAVSVAIFITLLIHIMGPLTGGHVSPIVTISFCVAGIIPPIQAFYYLFAQMIGATFAGILLALSLGSRASEIENYGCYFNPTPQFNELQVFIFEFMGAVCVIAMMYGFHACKGPQDQDSSKRINPLLNSLTLALFIFATSDFAPAKSYGGTNGFPTRCWASSVAIFQFKSSDWIFWLPAISAAAFNGLVHRYWKPCVEENPTSDPTNSSTNLIPESNPAGLPPKSDVIIQVNEPESPKCREKI